MILNNNYEPIFTKFAGNVPSNMCQNLSTFGAKNQQNLLRAAPQRRFSWFKTFPFWMPLSFMNRYSPNFWRMFLASSIHFCHSRVHIQIQATSQGGPLNGANV